MIRQYTIQQSLNGVNSFTSNRKEYILMEVLVEQKLLSQMKVCPCSGFALSVI